MHGAMLAPAGGRGAFTTRNGHGWPARQRNDVALGGALFAAHVLLTIRNALAHAVHVVGLGKPMLSVSSARIVGVDLALLHFLRPLLTACVSTVGMPAADLGRRCQFRRLVSAR